MKVLKFRSKTESLVKAVEEYEESIRAIQHLKDSDNFRDNLVYAKTRTDKLIKIIERFTKNIPSDQKPL